MMTVEHEDDSRPESQDDWDPGYGFAVIKLNGHVVRKTRLDHHIYPGDRQALEQYAAGWLSSLGPHE
jgi:hypothetical protein